jgi:pimeloyl-ACP methyl ester carboxylesterase
MSAIIRRAAIAAALLALALPNAACAQTERREPAALSLAPCQVEGVSTPARCGIYRVFENRRTARGRMLPLKIVVLPAQHPNPARGPIFYLAGGPGETASELAFLFENAPEREDMDIVLIDQRGTGEGHFLGCRSPGSDDDLAGYLKGPFDLPTVRACRDDLAPRFDLSQYHTMAWVEDIDEVRRAMGYDRINLVSGSFGTYAAQQYIRRYGAHVRAAYLLSPVLLSDRTPLHMPQDGQRALNQVFDQCAQDTACHSAYPRLRENFAAVLARLRRGPVATSARHPDTGARSEIQLTEEGFVDAMRVFLYRSTSAREIPYLIEQAAAGDFSAFADVAVRSARGFYGAVRGGVAFAVTCNEFVNRIRPEEVAPAGRGSFLGTWRIDRQRAACAIWPATDLPADYLASFRSDVPALIVGGDTDPVTPPSWANEIRTILPNSAIVIIPQAGHTEENVCVLGIRHAFFRTGSAQGLDTSCIGNLRPTPFRLPAR